MNEQSSRSHFVFTLRIMGFNEVLLFNSSHARFQALSFVQQYNLILTFFLSYFDCVIRVPINKYKVFLI